MNVSDEKSALRRHFSALRRNIPEGVRRQCDETICKAVAELEIFKRAETVAAFISHGAEVDLSSLFYGKRLLLPRFVNETVGYELAVVDDIKRDLLPGKYNIPEPKADLPAVSEDIAASRVLFLVPAVACDRQGTRLGRGGGYYDRLLKGVKTPPIAVIYSCQLSETPLPGTELDLPMGLVVTELEVIECAESKKTGETLL